MKEKFKITDLDLRILVSIGICCMTSTVLNYYGVKIPYGGMQMEIIQRMTACFTCLLCCQDNAAVSIKAGKMRILITLLGGIAAIIMVFFDRLIGNQWISILLYVIGVLLTIELCRAFDVPYINTRIGCISCILIMGTPSGNTRSLYAVMRLISTIYGVLVVFAVSWVWEYSQKKFKMKTNF